MAKMTLTMNTEEIAEACGDWLNKKGFDMTGELEVNDSVPGAVTVVVEIDPTRKRRKAAE